MRAYRLKQVRVEINIPCFICNDTQGDSKGGYYYTGKGKEKDICEVCAYQLSLYIFKRKVDLGVNKMPKIDYSKRGNKNDN